MRHPKTYVRFRRVMIAMTLAGLVVHVLYPLAPPRMFPNLGFVDTGTGGRPRVVRARERVLGLRQSVRGDAVAAFRVGARGGVECDHRDAQRRARWLIVLHPFLTLAAIVLTANHYWLDAIAATAALRRCVAPRPLADQACSPIFARIASGIGVES